MYHPQTDGLVEHFNRMLKSMILKFVRDDSRNWDKWLVCRARGSSGLYGIFSLLTFVRSETMGGVVPY